MSAVTLIRSVPVLPVSDVTKAVAFYRDNLGFAQAFEQGPYGEIEPRGIVDPQEPINTKPWGMRQFTVIDLCGNRLTFAENLNRSA